VLRSARDPLSRPSVCPCVYIYSIYCIHHSIVMRARAHTHDEREHAREHSRSARACARARAREREKVRGGAKVGPRAEARRAHSACSGHRVSRGLGVQRVRARSWGIERATQAAQGSIIRAQPKDRVSRGFGYSGSEGTKGAAGPSPSDVDITSLGVQRVQRVLDSHISQGAAGLRPSRLSWHSGSEPDGSMAPSTSNAPGTGGHRLCGRHCCSSMPQAHAVPGPAVPGQAQRVRVPGALSARRHALGAPRPGERTAPVQGLGRRRPLGAPSIKKRNGEAAAEPVPGALSARDSVEIQMKMQI
jgi:hypothetical protein